METGVSAALVRDSAAQVGPAVAELGAALAPLVPGYRTRVADGCHLRATQRRLKPLRQAWAAGLPGTAVAVYDRELDVVADAFLTPDGHAQERTLLGEVAASARPGDLWVADRGFCTLGFLADLIGAGAAFVVRRHASPASRPLGPPRPAGRCATGGVSEQDLEFVHGGRPLRLRCVSVALDAPTRGGDAEVHVLTNLPPESAGAALVAEVYRQRWTIEGRFHEVARTLNGEPDTLAYPGAALFAFCLALVASNAAALLRAALRSAHPAEQVAQMSSYYMADEVRMTLRGMGVVLPPPLWAAFGRLGVREFAALLREMAGRVRPAAYRKSKRGPKKKPPDRGAYRNGGHASTHRLLQQQKLTG